MNQHFNVFDAMLEDNRRIKVDKYYLEWYNLEEQYYYPIIECNKTLLFSSIQEAQEYGKKLDQETSIRKTEVWVDVK